MNIKKTADQIAVIFRQIGNPQKMVVNIAVKRQEYARQFAEIRRVKVGTKTSNWREVIRLSRATLRRKSIISSKSKVLPCFIKKTRSSSELMANVKIVNYRHIKVNKLVEYLMQKIRRAASAGERRGANLSFYVCQYS